MPYWTWTPRRGAPTNVFASQFGVWWDANRVGQEDGTTIDGFADQSGNGRRTAQTTSCTANVPSVAFSDQHDGIQVTTILGMIPALPLVEGDAAEGYVSSSTPPLTTNPDAKLTMVWVGQFDNAANAGFLVPLNGAGGAENDGALFSKSGGNWNSGSVNAPCDSGILADTDPHLFIGEWGTATSGLEVDGTLGDTIDMSTEPGVIPALILAGGDCETLFFGLVAGTLTEFQRQAIRDWVSDAVPTITIS